jgi:hypothetical protein
MVGSVNYSMNVVAHNREILIEKWAPAVDTHFQDEHNPPKSIYCTERANSAVSSTILIFCSNLIM